MRVPTIITKTEGNVTDLAFTGDLEFAITTRQRDFSLDTTHYATFQLPSREMVQDLEAMGMLEDYTKYVGQQLLNMLRTPKQ